jgi:hypothetical protein
LVFKNLSSYFCFINLAEISRISNKISRIYAKINNFLKSQDRGRFYKILPQEIIVPAFLLITPTWFNHQIEMNVKHFAKRINSIKATYNLNNLNRVVNNPCLKDSITNKDWSKYAINIPFIKKKLFQQKSLYKNSMVKIHDNWLI